MTLSFTPARASQVACVGIAEGPEVDRFFGWGTVSALLARARAAGLVDWATVPCPKTAGRSARGR